MLLSSELDYQGGTNVCPWQDQGRGKRVRSLPLPGRPHRSKIFTLIRKYWRSDAEWPSLVNRRITITTEKDKNICKIFGPRSPFRTAGPRYFVPAAPLRSLALGRTEIFNPTATDQLWTQTVFYPVSTWDPFWWIKQSACEVKLLLQTKKTAVPLLPLIAHWMQ